MDLTHVLTLLLGALIALAGTGFGPRRATVHFGDGAQVGAVNTGAQATLAGNGHGRLPTGTIAALEDATAHLLGASRALQDAQAFVCAVREDRYAGTVNEALDQVAVLLDEAQWRNSLAWAVVVAGRQGRYHHARGLDQGGRGQATARAARPGEAWNRESMVDGDLSM